MLIMAGLWGAMVQYFIHRMGVFLLNFHISHSHQATNGFFLMIISGNPYRNLRREDTLLADGNGYAKLNVYFPNSGTNPPIDGWAYLREDSNKLKQYPDKILLDYNMQIGDTVLSYVNPAPSDTTTNIYYDLPKATLLILVRLMYLADI